MAVNYPYKTLNDATSNWTNGVISYEEDNELITPTTRKNETKDIPKEESKDVFNTRNDINFNPVELTTPKTPLPHNMEKMDIEKAVYKTILDDENKKLQLYNNDKSAIKNTYNYPGDIDINESEYNKENDIYDDEGNIIDKDIIRTATKYDYQIIAGDPRYPIPLSLENKLREMRASLGIPVHGRQDLAKAMKYYMYNRYKVPDINMAHNKSFTHVFFTRPDCNLLQRSISGYTLSQQAWSNNEALLLWKRNPELFKLLVNKNHCGDSHNFNLLLSNQITSIEIQDETLSTNEAGKTWNQYEMSYGEVYTGRFAGEISCSFNETNDYSIINLMKLWITYIDAVSRGAWSPSYNLNGNRGISTDYEGSHVYTKTLDYASSIDVFKVGPDGEDVLYWSKYYGIFPINTGANALSWDIGNNPGDTPKLNIRFKYSFKRDMSPIALLEFNSNSDRNNTGYIPAYDHEYASTVRPYVGSPFIELIMKEPGLRNYNMVNLNIAPLSIRLKFNKFSHYLINDDTLYKNMKNS
jgi:hypothetical protein